MALQRHKQFLTHATLFPAAANLHAYIHYSDAATQTATVLLCGGMPDPAALAAAQQRMQQQLEAIGALQALISSAAAEQHMAAAGSSSNGGNGSSGGGSSGSSAATSLLAVPSLPPAAGGGRFGATPLLHFVYKLSARQQYVMAPFSPPLLAGGLQQVQGQGHGAGCLQPVATWLCSLSAAERAQHPDRPSSAPHAPQISLQAITVAYSQMRAAMFDGSAGSGGPLQRLRFEARPRFTLLGAGAWCGQWNAELVSAAGTGS